jgi:hypothetical protein
MLMTRQGSLYRFYSSTTTVTSTTTTSFTSTNTFYTVATNVGKRGAFPDPVPEPTAQPAAARVVVKKDLERRVPNNAVPTTIFPSSVPTYAAICTSNNPLGYSSACSCLSVAPATTMIMSSVSYKDTNISNI